MASLLEIVQSQTSPYEESIKCDTGWELINGWKDGDKIVAWTPLYLLFAIENIKTNLYGGEIISAELQFCDQNDNVLRAYPLTVEKKQDGSYSDIRVVVDDFYTTGNRAVRAKFSYTAPLVYASGQVAAGTMQESFTYKNIGTFEIVPPKWRATIEVDGEPPVAHGGSTAVLDELQVFNKYSASYDTFTDVPVKVVHVADDHWSFMYDFDTQYMIQPDETTRYVRCSFSYTSSVTHEKEGRKAFFSTSRNQNYSNGIYNSMFVSGVQNHPNYSSRVWWSQANNPLYFPDTNYSEVGSNDTAIMGLTKVGDYLCAVKQSKTTDTAIYLLYPTSFEQETTFAVKQGVQGVGALARYSFNILNDETLFLSPNGVMAIVPSEDEGHKTQNRSYFVDKRLLAETNISKAFSFVYDGKYFLSVGDGSVYVLDGNQRNSWGNDRTNLVYECYYLQNVPANSFAKFKDELVFEDGDNVCVFNDGYSDAYSPIGFDAPVFAEWSTLLDDDSAVHYYKTMQKKGNVISILPVENQRPYKEVEVTEEEYDEYKNILFVKEGKKYVKCTGDYDSEETYYIENRSATKVYVKRDDKDEVEIKRVFGLQSDIPSEMYLKKKFKKYKRLQFIIRNGAAEDFGIDEIIKSYTVGNYAKK